MAPILPMAAEMPLKVQRISLSNRAAGKLNVVTAGPNCKLINTKQ
eukprot:CAMPEP_0173169920 /NCGR_PEP_ID=MMETSP1141-20130122/964_1 /TAXON_ID=483371 /ORGANISM="non described non described, Strain CCMP2298" /LENGTH=44 /DNA_ID= /DNA_START= /DNA_END= /DNA_ORIENTATION=